MKKKIFSLIMAVTMLMNCSIVFGTSSNKIDFFPDVDYGHWAINYIFAMQQVKIIDGYEDGTFRPENQVKTGEFIKMASMAMWPKYEYKQPKEGDHWSVPYMFTLNYSVLDVNDYDNQRLESFITRAEAAEIVASIYKILNHEKTFDNTEMYIKNYTDESSITDSKTRRAVNTCTEVGIIHGFEDGSFRGNETLTRAQAAKIIYTTIYN